MFPFYVYVTSVCTESGIKLETDFLRSGKKKKNCCNCCEKKKLRKQNFYYHLTIDYDFCKLF